MQSELFKIIHLMHISYVRLFIHLAGIQVTLTEDLQMESPSIKETKMLASYHWIIVSILIRSS